MQLPRRVWNVRWQSPLSVLSQYCITDILNLLHWSWRHTAQQWRHSYSQFILQSRKKYKFETSSKHGCWQKLGLPTAVLCLQLEYLQVCLSVCLSYSKPADIQAIPFVTSTAIHSNILYSHRHFYTVPSSEVTSDYPGKCRRSMWYSCSAPNKHKRNDWY